MLNELHETVIERIKHLHDSTYESQKEIDAFLLQVIDRIKNNTGNNVITVKAPSETVGKTVQYLLTKNDIRNSLYCDVLAIYLQ